MINITKKEQIFNKIILPLLTYPVSLVLSYLMYLLFGFSREITLVPFVLILNNILLIHAISKKVSNLFVN